MKTFAAALSACGGVETARAEIPEGLRIDYALRPSSDSLIRCQVILPPPERWTGRLWGQGNGGGGGGAPSAMPAFARVGDAVVHTDLGTSDNRAFGKPEVWEDFAHRATHLMTRSAKALAETFYGRPPVRAYFYGASTGGNQGLMEAQRYPDDYDAVLAIVPALARVSYHVKYVWNMRQISRPDGARAISDAQIAVVERAVLDWFAGKDEPYAAGRFLTDGRWTQADEDGILALAASRDASLGDPDLRARFHRIWTGAVVNGCRASYGLPFGARLSVWIGKDYADSESWLWNWLDGRNRPLLSITDDELERWASGPGAVFNAMDPDLSRFAARGGKLLMTAGLEDDICEPTAHIAYAEAAAHAAGGVEKLSDFFRLYLNPGRAHGSGHHQGICDLADMWSALVDWREKGIAPDILQGVYDWSEAGFPDRVYGGPSKDPRGYPVAPWPDKMAGSAETGWRRVPFGRGGVPCQLGGLGGIQGSRNARKTRKDPVAEAETFLVP